MFTPTNYAFGSLRLNIIETLHNGLRTHFPENKSGVERTANKWRLLQSLEIPLRHCFKYWNS